MSPTPRRDTMRYHFDQHVLDVDARELVRDGVVAALEPQTFAVLAHLVEHRDRVVRKEELLDEVWGDRFVSESALTTRIKHCRKVLGDDGTAQRVIRTYPRVGYRFVAEVREEDGVGDRSGAPARWVGRIAPPSKPVFGRDDDVDELARRLDDHRLVTVTGPGGVGKSTLAALALTTSPGVGRGGGWWCALTHTRDPQALTDVVLAAIGEVRQSDADPVETLVRVLEARRGLLVLDNCDHVVETAGALVQEVLARCPDIVIVATSRVSLDMDGESVLSLAPLTPEDAVRCFCARATDAGAEVDPDDPAVDELCRRLDGVPLALELAAARARLLEPAEMLELLDDRFRLLHAPSGSDGPHQSLDRAIAWSWDDLTIDDQQLLARLSAFVGSFSLEDVRGVALDGGDPLDAVDRLEQLVRRSLLVSTTGISGRRRFSLLESVRDFAAARLDEPEEVRVRHASYYAALAERLDAMCQSEAIDDALDSMAAAWDNLRAAVGYAADAGDLMTARRIVGDVGGYADIFQVYEVLDWCRRAGLDAEVIHELDPVVDATALAVQARLLAHRGQHDRARAVAEGARERHESHATVLSMVWCAYYRGDLDAVVDGSAHLVELSRSERGLERGFADGFAAIAAAVRQVPELESTAITPAHAERGILGTFDCLAAGFRLCAADPERACALLEAVVMRSLGRDYRLLLGAAASTLTQIALPARPRDEAMRTLRRTLRLYRDRSMWVLIAADIVMAARLLADAGDADTAARLLGARDASGYTSGLSEVLRVLLTEELGRALGDRFTSLTADGAVWSPPIAADVAIDALDRALARAD